MMIIHRYASIAPFAMLRPYRLLNTTFWAISFFKIKRLIIFVFYNLITRQFIRIYWKLFLLIWITRQKLYFKIFVFPFIFFTNILEFKSIEIINRGIMKLSKFCLTSSCCICNRFLLFQLLKNFFFIAGLMCMSGL